MNKKWSQNDLIQEDDYEQDIDKVDTSPLLAKLEKDDKCKHKSSPARAFKYQKHLNHKNELLYHLNKHRWAEQDHPILLKTTSVCVT